MTEKLKPCKCGEPVVYYAPEAADELGWILCPKCFCEMSEFHFSSPDEMFTAWNTRATGWRPIDEARKDRTRLVFGWRHTPLFHAHIDVGYWSSAIGAWVNVNGEKFFHAPDCFQEITPPSSEAPHD